MEYFKNISIGVYVDTDSTIHRLDPRLKVVLLALMLGLVFLLSKWYELLWLGIFLLGIVYLSKVPLNFFWRSFRFMLLLIALAFFFNLLLTPGELLFKWHFIKISRPGLILGGMMALRITIILLATSLLTFTTSYLQLTDGLESLLKPFRKIGVPAHEIAMMLAIALRFLPLLLEEAEKIVKAQMSRGAEFDQGSIFKRAFLLLPLLVPLFVHAFKVAEDLAVAMEARCYQGGVGRTRLRELKIAGRDYWAIFVFGFITFILLGAEWLSGISK